MYKLISGALHESIGSCKANLTFTTSLIDNLFKPSFDLGVRPYCLTHSNLIRNYFNDAVLIDSKSSGQINHNRDIPNNAKNLLIKNKNPLEYYDNINNINDVINDFRMWLANSYNHPKILHAHGYDDYDNEISATWEALNRFQSNRNIKPLSDALNNYKGSGVFLTLTVDHKKVKSLNDAWLNIAKQWNKFITRLRIELKQKKLNYIWVLEAQGNGYPHIHALFLGIDYLFYAGNKQEWINDNPHSKNLKHFWNWGSVFINSTKSKQSVKNPINYMMKYIRKTFDPYSKDNKKELTQALLWAFNKRSWNTSRGIFDFLNYHTKISSIDLELVEMDTFEKLKGQSTPYVRIINVPNPDYKNTAYEVWNRYTTSKEDQSYLMDKLLKGNITYEEISILDDIIINILKGIDKSYKISRKYEKIRKPYIKKVSQMGW